MKRVRQACYLKAINLSVFFVATRIITFVCFVTYVLLGHTLNAEAVFVCLALFNSLRLSVTFFFPQCISVSAELLITCKRIEVKNLSKNLFTNYFLLFLKNFLLMDEINLDEVKSEDHSGGNPEKKTPSLVINNISAKWTSVILAKAKLVHLI